VDLNTASRNYVNAIGNASAQKYNLNEGDMTHLNPWGSVVFGRILADALLAKSGGLKQWFRANETLSTLIRKGLPA
jgi:hypothetical protein